MKTLIFIILLMSAKWSVFAQTTQQPLAVRMDLTTRLYFVPKDSLTDGKVGTMEIKVKSFDVYKTSSGQYYVETTNEKLVKSRKYLGYTFGKPYFYENNSVFLSADTAKAWIWTTDKYGQIFKMELPNHFAGYMKSVLKQKTNPYEK
jgi:hypothetical protein